MNATKRESDGQFVAVETESERFWRQVLKTDTCWLWQGAKYHSGYGKFRLSAKPHKQVRTHRYVLFGANAANKDDNWALHKCDIRACVNPDHLYVGNRKDNVRDLVERGSAKSRGI